MKFRHKNHLFCSYLSLRNIAEQVTSAATKGVSPSGTGSRGTPLPEGEWRAVEKGLRECLEALSTAVQQLASGLAEEHQRNAGLGATRAWVAVLLGQALEVIEDLEPARFSKKFRPLGASESRLLETATARAKRWMEAARAQLGKG